VGSTSNLRSHPAVARPTAEVIDLTLDSDDDESSKSVKKTLDVIDLTADVTVSVSHHVFARKPLITSSRSRVL
jgi:hypothetical protein